jgi:hypothetical protein
MYIVALCTAYRLLLIAARLLPIATLELSPSPD